jgi:excisionase family DNA binding protein
MTEPQHGAWPLAPLLRPNDVAQLLSVSRAWVYEAARTGRIPSFRLGGEDGPLRFVAEDIERWLAEARAGWLPRRNGRPRPGTPEEHFEAATGTAGSSVVPIRGQQSLL